MKKFYSIFAILLFILLQSAKADEMLSWGMNSSGQLGLGSDTWTIEQIGTISNWKMLSSGSTHSEAIKDDGSLWAWGLNYSGQLGNGTENTSKVPVQIGSDSNWVQVACGFLHNLAIKDDGSLWAWGNNNNGEIGDGTDTNRLSPVQIGTDSDWVFVACGYYHSIAIKSNGSLWTWGNNENGQLGDSSTTNRFNPVQIGSDSNWVTASGGNYHTLAIKTDGTLWAWGSNVPGETADTLLTNLAYPVQIGSDTNWVNIKACGRSFFGIKENSTLWAWGINSNGQLGDGTDSTRFTPVQIGTDSTWADISPAGNFTIALKTDGSFWGWGSNTHGQLSSDYLLQYYSPVQIGSDNDWRYISDSHGGNSTFALKTNGTLWACGYNTNGELGNGKNQIFKIKTLANGATNWLKTSGGMLHSAAIRTDGTLWTWGNNNFGQLGNGTLNSISSPEQIGSDTQWKEIAAGEHHTCAVKIDSTLWVWGNNSFGQLGDSTFTNKTEPIQIGDERTWKNVACGYNYSIGLKYDGTLWASGQNSEGQLGIGNNSDTAEFVQIGTDADWAFVACGYKHSLAIKSNGTLWAWGLNDYGQLGDSTRTDKLTPVQIGTAYNWAAVACGYSHTLALQTNGSLWAWGNNPDGELGIGSYDGKIAPIQVGSDSNWVKIACGAYYSSAVKSDSSLWSWGTNMYTLSNPDIETNVPIQIDTEKYWSYVSSVKGFFSIVLRYSQTQNSIVVGINPNESFCNGFSYKIPYTATGEFNQGNVFTAQLSDNVGNFGVPVNIGSYTSTNLIDSIEITIPILQTEGTGYRMRIIASDAPTIGADNGSNLILSNCNSISVSTETLCSGLENSLIMYANGYFEDDVVFQVALVSADKNNIYPLGDFPISGFSGTKPLLFDTLNIDIPSDIPLGYYYLVAVSEREYEINDSIEVKVCNTISTGEIIGSPFCAGDPFNVPYTATLMYDSTNVFTALLSDKYGSFDSPVTIGAYTSTETEGFIVCFLPEDIASGTSYRVRVSSSSPASIGSDNGADLIIGSLTPTLQIPPNNNLSLSQQVNFTWFQSCAAAHTIQVSPGSDFSTIIIETPLTINTYSPDYVFVKGEKYYWRVKSSIDTLTSNWSEVWSFSIILDQPVLVSPADSATKIPIEDAVFNWNKVAGAKRYSVEFADDAAFTNVLLAYNAYDTALTADLYSNSFTFYWRAKAKSDYVESTWSAVRKFTTARVAPKDTVYLLFPSNGAVNIPLSFDFLWNSIDSIDTYHLVLTYNEVVIKEDSLIPVSQNYVETYPSDSLEPLTTYLWKVRGVNDGGVGPWSETYSFTTTQKTAVDDIITANGNISIYPNPADNMFNITFNSESELQVKISLLNIMGEEISTIYKESCSTGHNIIRYNIGNLSPGMYLIKFESKAGTKVYKIVKL